MVLVNDSEFLWAVNTLIVLAVWYSDHSVLFYLSSLWTVGWVDFHVWKGQLVIFNGVFVEQVKGVVVSLPLHDCRAISWSVEDIEGMSVRWWVPAENPMFSLVLTVEFSSCSDNYKLGVANQLFDVSASHKSILLHKFGWVDDIPFVGVNLISVGHNEIKVIVESDSINSESVHIHFNFKEIAHIDGSVAGKNNFIKTLVIGQEIKLAESNLIVNNG